MSYRKVLAPGAAPRDLVGIWWSTKKTLCTQRADTEIEAEKRGHRFMQCLTASSNSGQFITSTEFYASLPSYSSDWLNSLLPFRNTGRKPRIIDSPVLRSSQNRVRKFFRETVPKKRTPKTSDVQFSANGGFSCSVNDLLGPASITQFKDDLPRQTDQQIEASRFLLVCLT